MQSLIRLIYVAAKQFGLDLVRLCKMWSVPDSATIVRYGNLLKFFQNAKDFSHRKNAVAHIMII